MAEFDNIQDLLNDFRDNVIREAKKKLIKPKHFW